MNARVIAGLLALSFGLGICTATQAASIWNETADGDLSNDGLAPTPLLLSAGSNSLTGTVGNLGGAHIDRDYFSISVPTESLLTSLVLTSATSVSGGYSFIALQAGPQLTVTPEGAGLPALLGYMHYGNDLIGIDLLPYLAPAFSAGLPTGVYSLWVQETGGPATYGLDFSMTPVPLPGAALLLLSGLFGLARLRKGRESLPLS